MENLELPLRNKNQEVPDDIVFKLPDFQSALKMCKDISGLDDKFICAEIGIDPGQWSRIWSGQANFPHNKLNCFMNVCGNEIPLRWLNFSRGYEMRPMKTTLEKENDALRIQLERQQIEIDAIKKFMKEVKG